MSAYLVLMSGAMKALIGETLHDALLVRVLAIAAKVSEPVPDG